MITNLRIGLVIIALICVTLALLPFQLLGLALDLRLRRFVPRYWHRAACWLLGIRIHVHGKLETRRPLMLASNHVSWKDIMVLGAGPERKEVVQTPWKLVAAVRVDGLKQAEHNP